MTSDSVRYLLARRKIERQAFTRFLSSVGGAHDFATRAAARAQFDSAVPLLDERVHRLCLEALGGARGPAVAGLTWTVWQRVDWTHGGRRVVGSWSDFGRWHLQWAHAVAAKGQGLAYNPTINSDGHRCNASTSQITALVLDADGTGAWDDLLHVLTAHDLAALAHQSGGHTDAVPKWRIILPLATPYDTSTPERRAQWRSDYLSARTVFGALARLRGPGFDPTTDGPHHPWYPGSRRSNEAKPREVLQRVGSTLDLQSLLRRLPPPETGAGAQEVLAQPPSGETSETLLALAFREAGLLGRPLGGGRFAVFCPWNEAHTEPLRPGDQPSSSTVIWPASTASNVGGFSCAHSCGSPSVEDVLDALPADAVQRAYAQHVRWDEEERGEGTITPPRDLPVLQDLVPERLP